MGSAPSAPVSRPISMPVPPPPPPPPPLPPPCDLECQKAKELVNLQRVLDAAAINKKQDPKAYQNARIAYYTLAEGHGWLAKEKERIAKEEVEPILSGFSTNYESMKGEQKTHSIFSNLARVLRAQKEAGIEDNDYLNKRLTAEKDKEKTLNRTTELGGPHIIYSYFPMMFDIFLVLLGLTILYVGYAKFDKLKALVFRTETQSFPTEY